MSASDTTVVVLLGSLRRDAATRAIANTLDELAPDAMQITLLDSPAVIAHYNRDVEVLSIPAGVEEMGAEIAAADGVVIITPEYEQTLPGALKNTLDWLTRLPSKPLKGKPLVVQTATHSISGGHFAHSHLCQVLCSAGGNVLEGSPVKITEIGRKVDLLTDSLVDGNARAAIAEQLERLAASIDRLRRDGPSDVA